MKKTLTDASLRALKPAEKQYTVWDAISPLGVRVSKTTKTYIVMVGSGQRKMLGQVGILELKDARQEAKNTIAHKTLGTPKKSSPKKFSEGAHRLPERQLQGAPAALKEGSQAASRVSLPAALQAQDTG
ncbi:MAG TPA: Arm DNA-binding domain-containing protein [Xanthobacteraceae bacterium]|jgi:hypothetical protein